MCDIKYKWDTSVFIGVLETDNVMVATTTTGMFLVCFDALCPCFGSKRKDGSEDPVLARGATSCKWK